MKIITNSVLKAKMAKFKENISNWNVSNVRNMDLIFFTSHFKGDLSNWKPYNLEKTKNSLKLNSLIPYWIAYDDKEGRQKAIDAYHLHKELNNELSENNIPTKKLKI